MPRRYYFSTVESDEISNDHVGNIRGARTVAKKLANELDLVVYINWIDIDVDEIVDAIYPDAADTEDDWFERNAKREAEIIERQNAEAHWRYLRKVGKKDYFADAEASVEEMLEEYRRECEKEARVMESIARKKAEKTEVTETVESTVESVEETTVSKTETVETESESDTEAGKPTSEYQTICTVCDVNGATKSLAIAKWNRRNSGQAPPEIS